MKSFRYSSMARLPAAVLLTTSIAAACAPGFRYTGAPPLQFSELDYGLPVHYALSRPQVAYIDQGSGDTVLLLIHGLGGNAGFWRYNIAELARHHRVIAVDLPGHGRSQKDGAYPYDMEFHAATLSRLVTELGLEQVVPVGHSMGGQIAMTLALRYPEQVSQLVLVAPAGFESFGPGAAAWLRGTLTTRSVVSTDEEEIRRNLSGNFYNWRDDLEWLVEERARMAQGDEMVQYASAVIRSLEGMLDQPTSTRLGRITHPALVIYGRYDGRIPNPYLHPGHAAGIFRAGAAAMPDATLVEIDKAGHMLMIEQPDAFNEAVLRYVSSR
jgi:pimeloyl-ACP methyl ester carboxylesterase